MFGGAQNRCKPLIPAAAPEIFRRPQPAAKNSASRQDHQRQRHYRRRFAQMRTHMRLGATLAVKHQQKLAKHIKCRQTGGYQTDRPEPVLAMTESTPKDQVLGEETCGE